MTNVLKGATFEEPTNFSRREAHSIEVGATKNSRHPTIVTNRLDSSGCHCATCGKPCLHAPVERWFRCQADIYREIFAF